MRAKRKRQLASLVYFGGLFCLPYAKAQSRTATEYTFAVGSGFVCESGDSGSCPAIAKSASGDSYEISGAGTFEVRNKTVKAAGTFTQKSPSGDAIETGVWIADELMSFDSYGAAPNALKQRGSAFTHPQMGTKRIRGAAGAMPTGGLATLRVVVMPVSGSSRTAVLQLNCALGNVPQERSVEGVRIEFENKGGEYLEEGHGKVMFLALGSQSAPATKTSADSGKAEGENKLPR